MKRIPLKLARKNARLTQAELAEAVGTTQAAISKLENGKVPPPRIDEAKLFGKALGVDPLALVYGKAS